MGFGLFLPLLFATSKLLPGPQELLRGIQRRTDQFLTSTMIRRRLISRKWEDRFWLGFLYSQVGLLGVTWAGIFAYQRKYPGIEWRLDLAAPAPELTWEKLTKQWPAELYNLFFVCDEANLNDLRKEVSIERNKDLADLASKERKK